MLKEWFEQFQAITSYETNLHILQKKILKSINNMFLYIFIVLHLIF